uniref:Transcription initiation factor TFIID subunit 12 n=1 Tax=Panagrellus redivivus TaxID=6233 RepID=A0A7E4ZV88_PANRE
MEEDASRDDAPVTVHGTDSHVTEETSAVSVPNGATEATVAVSNGRVIEGETAEETKIMTAIDALCKLFQHRAKANANRNPTTEDLQNIVNTGHDLVREAFGQIDPAFEGYEDLKKMIYKVIPDAPKPPRRRKQARPMKVEYHPPHGVLSVWMARLRRLQDAVDQFVDQTRTERHKRNQEPTSSTRL